MTNVDAPEATLPPPVSTPISDLRPHPRNYRSHPDDQLAHIVESIREHGFYRNVVAARDGTILAGHGVVEASRQIGLSHVPLVRLDLDPDEPRALKLLAGDNEISRLAEVDDRTLTDLLAELRATEPDLGLLGTGFDDAMLANLVFVTRPASEIADMDEAALWVGMPEYEAAQAGFNLVVHCEREADRERLVEILGVTISKKIRQTWSTWWPPQDKQDLSSVEFDG